MVRYIHSNNHNTTKIYSFYFSAAESCFFRLSVLFWCGRPGVVRFQTLPCSTPAPIPEGKQAEEEEEEEEEAVGLPARVWHDLPRHWKPGTEARCGVCPGLQINNMELRGGWMPGTEARCVGRRLIYYYYYFYSLSTVDCSTTTTTLRLSAYTKNQSQNIETLNKALTKSNCSEKKKQLIWNRVDSVFFFSSRACLREKKKRKFVCESGVIRCYY